MNLSTDIILYICSFILKEGEILSLTLVCKKIRSFICNHPLPNVEFSVKSVEGIKKLYSIYKNITSIVCKFRDICSQDKYLVIKKIKQRTRKLKILGGRFNSMSVESWGKIFALKNLQVLYVNVGIYHSYSFDPLTSSSVIMSSIINLQNLYELHIYSTDFLRTCSRYLKELKNLKTLDVYEIDNNIFKELCEIKTLQKFEFVACNSSYLDTSYVRKLSELTELTISSSGSFDNFEHIFELKKLKEINFLNNILTDNNLLDIYKLNNLQVLILCYTSIITDKGFQVIFNLVSLIKLVLGDHSKLTDSGLVGIDKLCNLEELNLGNESQITDLGIKEIYKMKKLKSLDLGDYSNITNQGITGIDRLLTLEKLDVGHYSKLTMKALRYLCLSTKLYYFSN